MRKSVWIVAIIFLASCAKPSLTREEAQRLLAASKKYPKAVRTTKVPAGDQGGCTRDPELEEPMVSYIGDELMTVATTGGNPRDPRCGHRQYYEYLYGLTPEGQKYVESYGRTEDNFVVVKQCVAELGEVTGVATESDGTVARAQYTTKITPTPFNVGAGERCDTTRTQTATFRRFDDGWRLEKDVNP